MDEVSPDPATAAVPERVGGLLRATRERGGLSLPEVAARTRVPLRHLEAIEANDYSGLPSPTYATGFARAYARTVGADEVEVARGVRAELAGVVRPQAYQPYEATDPARVPSRRLTTVSAGLAALLLILAGLFFTTNLFRRGGTAAPVPEIAAVTPGTAVALPPTPTPSAGGQVLVTATDEVWVRIYDAGGKTLHQGILKAGEHFDVPADAADPMINVGRPDKILITLNGSQLQGLNLGADPIKDVRVSAAALQARASGKSPPTATVPAASVPSAAAPLAGSVTATRTPERTPDRTGDLRTVAAAPLTAARRSPRDDPPARPPARSAATPSETQRANLDAAGGAPAATPPSTPPPGNTQ